jgi:SAM-dependent methyltransferase
MSLTAIQHYEVLDDSQLRALLLQYRRENWQGIQTPDWQEKIVDSIVEDDGEAVLTQVSSFWNIPHRASVLDIGSGVGSFVLACRRRGLLAFGVEPDRIGQGGRLTSVQIARRRIKDGVFAVAIGETLPFPDCIFDLIVMNQVMEHVTDQAAVLGEAVRVLKPGGAVYIACPNYLRFYEPHYKIKWLPLLPKLLGRLYLKCRGRSPTFLSQLTYTTNARLRALFRGLKADCKVVDLHQEQFLKKCTDGSFASVRARLVAQLIHLSVLGSLIRWAALQYLHITEGGCEMLILRSAASTDNTC